MSETLLLQSFVVDAMEEEDKKLFKWRIASFIGTIIVGSATIILLDRVTNSNGSFIPSFMDSSQQSYFGDLFVEKSCLQLGSKKRPTLNFKRNYK